MSRRRIRRDRPQGAPRVPAQPLASSSAMAILPLIFLIQP